ncbi:MAG: molybdopterin molybdotransferase MoeA [Acidimicrobiales bacterium]|nr:molybdopterin molybdotransferase MoeA [Acidimicrobiales bacterium]MYB81327.1 molybdopterin molybdotransferase MoeA [Acidimicrobiales bacterium]MYD83650.1 molybdopterin molybdotransferase MoeA [Acidimicrobiales bacterium]MYI12729.1 molybdopterin molybdotransferase MoeA [Acidimicrobiales bacterium]MYJ66757.1 molybdopterin molybdotransferase MoeA [Acidimicrobiales bacterium]
MLPLESVREFVLDRCPARAPQSVPVADALGLVTASEIISSEAIPQFANTAMDGFAVRSVDVVDAPCELRVVETIAAGHAPQVTVGPGEASRIMTGAIIPPGADAVVMVERTSLVTPSSTANPNSTAADGSASGNGAAETVRVEVSVPPGNHVRPVGDDLHAGTHVFAAGTELTAGHLGVLCSLGMTEVEVFPRLRVGVLSTGDELVDDGSPLRPGQIRDSNRRTLLALAHRADVVPIDLGLSPDDPDAIETAITTGVQTCDAIVTSGGVSMGDFDYVKAVLDRIGDMRWMQVAIKPAKPLAFGTVGDVPVFGLPGNPVSSMVSFELFARPGLRSMMGHPDPVRSPVTATAAEDLPRRSDGKTHFMRVLATPSDGGVEVRSAGGQGSHMLWAMAKANALAVVPDGDGVRAGGPVDVLLLD